MALPHKSHLFIFWTWMILSSSLLIRPSDFPLVACSNCWLISMSLPFAQQRNLEREILKEDKTFLMGASNSSMNTHDITQNYRRDLLALQIRWVRFLMCKKEVETEGSYSAFVDLLTFFLMKQLSLRMKECKSIQKKQSLKGNPPRGKASNCAQRSYKIITKAL